MNSIIQSMVDQPPLVALLIKMTILLGVAWLLHFALTRRNPRWRVFLWRGAMLGVALLPLAMWVAPKFAVKVADPSSQTNAAGVMRGNDQITAGGVNYQSEPTGASKFDFQQKKPAYAGMPKYLPMLFAIGWAIVTAILAVRLIFASYRLRRALGNCRPASASICELADKIAKDLQCPICPAIRIVRESGSPFAAGVINPVIVLPHWLVSQENRENLRAILTHELAHTKSRDIVWILFWKCLALPLWFHPLIWRVGRAHLSGCEEVCDSLAVQHASGVAHYSGMLARIALAAGPHAPAHTAVPMIRPADITKRLRFLKRGNPCSALTMRWIVSFLLLGSFAFAALSSLKFVHAQSEPSTSSTTSGAEVRVVQFPQDRSLGWLKVRENAPTSPSGTLWAPIVYWDHVGIPDHPGQYVGWEELAEARGEVVVPAGKNLGLTLSKEAALDLSSLGDLGPDDLQFLEIHNADISNSDLAHLRNLTGLRALSLHGCKYIGDEGMEHIVLLKSLSFLALNATSVSDAGLDTLTGLKSLEEGLQIAWTQISDEGLGKLDRFTRLRHLRIGGDVITDDGLRRLQSHPALENIWFYPGLNTSSEGVAYLANIPNLEKLKANGLELSDATIAQLAEADGLFQLNVQGLGDKDVDVLSKLPALQILEVYESKITTASVPSFKKMKSIANVAITGKLVGRDLLEALQAALPGAKVWDPRLGPADHPVKGWRKRFETVYHLEDDEVLRRIPPPFIPERMIFYRLRNKSQAESIPAGPEIMFFDWYESLSIWGQSFGRGVGTIPHVLSISLRLTRDQYDGPKALLDIEIPGDWIVRTSADHGQLLNALEDILDKELQQSIRFRKTTVVREVIVATGSFDFRPLPGVDAKNEVHLFADQFEPHSGAGGHGAASVNDMLRAVADFVNQPVLDETRQDEDLRIDVRFHAMGALRESNADPVEKASLTELLLENLSRQTSLDFALETRETEIWLVETTDAHP